jgi:hypothetical protein
MGVIVFEKEISDEDVVGFITQYNFFFSIRTTILGLHFSLMMILSMMLMYFRLRKFQTVQVGS